MSLVVPFLGISSGGSWVHDMFRSYTKTNRNGEKRKGILKIKYRIVTCDNHFTGADFISCDEHYK